MYCLWFIFAFTFILFCIKYVGRLYQADMILYYYIMNYKRLFIPNSLVFLTFVTQNRNDILIDNIALLKLSLFNTIKIYKYKLIAYTVQTNHIHCIIKPKNISDYSNIIKSFKYSFSSNYKNKFNTKIKIWQNRFWEHTIRDEQDFNTHLDYIHYNSIKHNNILPKDWKYSSFSKFVEMGLYEEDWCNFSDKNNIKSLNFE